MKILSFIMISLLALTGCSNIFSPLSNKESPEAVYEDGRKAMNDQNYDVAIAKFESLPASYQDRTEFKETLASAYAGKCGLNFVEFLLSLGSADLSSSSFFKFLMNAFTDRAVSPDFCRKAQLKMEEISTDPALRTSSQNLFMAILGMVKVGTYLRSDADRDGSNGMGDGDADIPPVNLCDDTETASDPDGWFSDDEIDEIVTGTGLLIENIASVPDASSDITDVTDNIGGVCSGCAKTQKADVNAGDRLNFRKLLRTSPSHPITPLGVGDCNNMDPNTCC